VDADAEHQEDDADLGELGGELGIRHVARREWPDDHATHQIADDRWHPKPHRENAAEERRDQAQGNRGDEFGFMRHRAAPVTECVADTHPDAGEQDEPM
jgi:hypothetical protein